MGLINSMLPALDDPLALQHVHTGHTQVFTVWSGIEEGGHVTMGHGVNHTCKDGRVSYFGRKESGERVHVHIAISYIAVTQ